MRIELVMQCMWCGRRKVPTEPIEKTCCNSTAKTLFSLGSYENPVLSALIKAAKIQKYTDIYAFLGSLIATELTPIKPQLNQFTLVPIPAYAKTKSLRGFNHAQLFTHSLFCQLHIPIAEPMVKLKDTTPQHTLAAYDRFQTIKGAFGIKLHAHIPSHVLLVDDVKTTGATLREATRILKVAGAKQVCALTIAS